MANFFLRILFLLCAGSYATNSAMVLIGSNDPPAEAGFSFLALSRAAPAPQAIEYSLL
ncbi:MULTISPECIES: hypothetical protein [unclassified Mesorhizobium]|uniref:hypothetical protein n=1 Tax=unclassified Mesorhizobium TaxID=325217 RepID=UPI00333D7566